MKISRLVRNNLTYYWKKNALLALGIAISAAVLTGALIVGDSVTYSLKRIVDLRLGRVTHVVRAGDRYFSRSLAGEVERALQVPVSPLLLQEGVAVADGGRKRINHVQVLGVDPSIDRIAGRQQFFGSLSGDTIIISRNLSDRLNVSAGDEILLRIRKASLIPPNAPFVSDAGNTLAFRAVIRSVADEDELGRFNLRVSQTAPFNVFIASSRLEELMDFTGMVNVMLLEVSKGVGRQEIFEAVRHHFSPVDAGLKISYHEEPAMTGITSERVFIDDTLSSYLLENASSGESHARGIITYFVNELRSSGGSTPYSFVSTLPAQWLRKDEIIISDWLAEDLKAVKGDTIRLTYYVVGPLRELKEDSAVFTVRSVVPMKGRFADRELMPAIPGLSDAGNCRDWDTGVPISLESIRDKDEDYWDRYRGIPKAYISVEKGVELWKNRFGTYTAVRLERAGGNEAGGSGRVPPGGYSGIPATEAGGNILEGFDPASLGFTVEAARSRGFEAAGSGVDFSQLFGGLSFFLLVAGILLAILLFLLNIESRKEQLRTLVVLGIPVKTIRSMMLAEAMAVVLVGTAAGLVLSVLYNRLVFWAINGVWRDVVRTEMMQIDIRITTLLTGFVITFVISIMALLFPLNRMLKREVRSHIRSETRAKVKGQHARRLRRRWALFSIVTGSVAIGLIVWQLSGTDVVNAPVFFTAGGLLLLSALFFFLWYLERISLGTGKEINLVTLSWKNALRNRTRSMSIVILFAIGAFLVISTGSNRKDLFRNAEDPSSGTGGFLYYAESTVPVLQKLDDPDVRFDYGLEEDYEIIQLRKAEGDDASCLNLNRVVNPRILGVDPAQLEGRFSFVTRTGLLDEEKPWLSLSQELPDGLIPAIADETVIKWGLGMKVGDTLRYVNPGGETMELFLIGGLAPSIFQGSVIISNKHFLEQFPGSSGTGVFLVEGETADTASIRSELERGLRDLGWEMQLSARRLAEFNSVTNTYLSIFMVMGALGLLVGTFGLAVVLSRSILERKQEIALLKAVGYGRKRIRRVVTREYMLLLLIGIITGFTAAIVATLPSILSAHAETSFTSILAWLLILVLNGWIWIRLIAGSALKDASIYTALRNE